jgi:hypothetical protein
MQDAQDHYVIGRNAIVYGVWKATGEGPPNILVDYRVQFRGAVDTVEHLLYAQQERRPKSFPLPLIPGPCGDQVSLRFRADYHVPGGLSWHASRGLLQAGFDVLPA